MKNQGQEDNEKEVNILDKCCMIQPATSSQQKNWEDKLMGRPKSDDSRLFTHPRPSESQTNFYQFSSDSKPNHTTPVNLLVKPFSRTTSGDTSILECTGGTGAGMGSGKQDQQQPGGLCKLELFRKKMEKDEAIASIGGGRKWNDARLRENKEVYLKQDWTVDDFVYYVCSDEFQTSWDIVKLESGEIGVKIERMK